MQTVPLQTCRANILRQVNGSFIEFEEWLCLLIIHSGIPVGYILRLEARLAETEAALFQTISEQLGLSHHDADSIVASFNDHHSQQSRTDRLESWERTPLSDTASRQRWWSEYQEQLVIPDTRPAQHAAVAPTVPTDTATVHNIVPTNARPARASRDLGEGQIDISEGSPATSKHSRYF